MMFQILENRELVRGMLPLQPIIAPTMTAQGNSLVKTYHRRLGKERGTMQTASLNSPIAWVGGKRQLRKYIVPLIPDDHKTYIEGFIGGAWVLFGKAPSETEVINDINGELANFWRVIKQRHEAFCKEMQYLFSSREIFSVLKDLDRCYLSEVVRAARFYYLNKNSFGARGINVGAGPGRHRTINFEKLEANIEEVSRRISHVLIEQLDFRQLIKKYDRPETLFYLDPPYVDYPGCYEHDFTDRDHRDLAELLHGLKGRFILSYNNHPLIKQLYRGYKMKNLDTRYSLNDKGNKRVVELLIANY